MLAKPKRKRHLAVMADCGFGTKSCGKSQQGGKDAISSHSAGFVISFCSSWGGRSLRSISNASMVKTSKYQYFERLPRPPPNRQSRGWVNIPRPIEMTASHLRDAASPKRHDGWLVGQMQARQAQAPHSHVFSSFEACGIRQLGPLGARPWRPRKRQQENQCSGPSRASKPMSSGGVPLRAPGQSRTLWDLTGDILPLRHPL